MGKSKLKSRMKNLLMFLPNMVILCGKLMVDKRVPRTERALFAAAVIYAIIPFDFIPDMIPFVGQIDDLFLISLTLLRLIDHTDDLIVREHWRGGGDIVQLAESAATIAPLLMPKRIARVLIAKVRSTAEGSWNFAPAVNSASEALANACASFGTEASEEVEAAILALAIGP